MQSSSASYDVAMNEGVITVCSRCGLALADDAKSCPRCGQFVHLAELNRLAAQAVAAEAQDPLVAAQIWQDCLQLIPADSPQYRELQQRIGMLTAGFISGSPYGAPGVDHSSFAQAQPGEDSFTKTFLSMLVSMAVYAWFLGSVQFAVGFVILILIHEMGHVVANRFYGLNASLPVFIPFMGAVINLRERPANAKVEAVIGIAGPIAGSLGALGCYLAYQQTHSQLMLELAYFGFLINLFNLLPVPPLDGGRITAAVSPWIWLAGLGALAWMFIHDYQNGYFNWILILVCFYAFPRIQQTLKARGRFDEYYNISKASSWTIGVMYVTLASALIYFYFLLQPLLRPF